MASPGCRSSGTATDTETTQGASASLNVRAAVTFVEVRPILQKNCTASCHDGQSNSLDDFVFKDDRGDLYERLLAPLPATVPAACQKRPLVVPGRPDRSLLVAMIEKPDGPRGDCAERMPHRCPERRSCITPGDLKTIRVWIEAGAPLGEAARR